MIKLKNIPDFLINKHWDYFVDSEGYGKINSYSNALTLRQKERELYSELQNNTVLLKKIITGTPIELLECINAFLLLTNELPELKFAQLPSFKVIELSINTKNTLTNTERNDNKRSILEKLVEIDNLSLSEGLYTSLKFNELVSNMRAREITIKKIKKLYKDLKYELKDEIENMISRLFEVFDYKHFTSNNFPWGAYPLTRFLEVSVCPYCNRNYVNTVETESGKTRPELDHYYPKSRFPFLALSIYNLIPSCHTCNANLKGSIDFYTIKHIHPYADNLTQEFEFLIDVNDSCLGETIPSIDDFKITAKPITVNEDEIIKISNSIETFKLVELYNEHKDVAKEILEKALFYNKTRLLELANFFDEIENSDQVSSAGQDLKLDEQTKRFLLGNFVEEADIGKRTLAKFVKDIAMRTELKKYI